MNPAKQGHSEPLSSHRVGTRHGHGSGQYKKTIGDVVRVPCVLVADDNDSIRAMLVAAFKSDGYDVEALWTALQAHVTDNMWLGVRSTARIGSIVFTPLDGAGASVEKTAPATSAFQGGSGAGDIVPQVSILCSHQTELRGRNWRGRTYLPYVSESAISGGVYDDSARATQQTTWNTFRGAMASDSVPLVIASYELAGSANTSHTTVRGFLATQRRRQQRS